jgi:predicted RecB family endonuclease
MRPRAAASRDIAHRLRSGLRRFVRTVLARHAPRLFVRFAAPTTAELGLTGEELAANALRRKGWRLLGRRVATPFAEIDIVAKVGAELVCIEVKAGRFPTLPIRSGASASEGAPLSGIRFRPGARLARSRIARQRQAGRYLARHLAYGQLTGGRVDLVEVAFRGREQRIELLHHQVVGASVQSR